MITSMTYALSRTRIRTLKTSAYLALLLVVSVSALAQTWTNGRNLYLLAGTPTNWGPEGWPVTLYSVDSQHKLNLVRAIVPGADTPIFLQAGLYAVRDDMGDKIYVAYPHGNPTTVSVIHKDRPTMKDEVVFNPQNLTVLNTDFGVASGDGGESYLLCTLLRDDKSDPARVNSVPVSVAGDEPAKGPRILQNDWSLYSSFRYAGAPGGPMGTGFCTEGYIKDNHVRIQAEAGAGPFTMKLDLDGVPPFPLEGYSGLIYIVAASARYFVFGLPGGHSSLYVHDRKLNTWKNLKSASTVAYARRIFGSWLATIVEIWGSGQQVEQPGVENERNWETPLLPNVRGRYPSLSAESGTSIPGTLLLDNLEDGRRITLETGQEDSEILDVRGDGLVLYRVNDSIFAAPIESDRLGTPSLVVKDEDVPEVHWVFWSLSETSPSVVTP